MNACNVCHSNSPVMDGSAEVGTKPAGGYTDEDLGDDGHISPNSSDLDMTRWKIPECEVTGSFRPPSASDTLCLCCATNSNISIYLILFSHWADAVLVWVTYTCNILMVICNSNKVLVVKCFLHFSLPLWLFGERHQPLFISVLKEPFSKKSNVHI